ncbi:hypothetical protein ACFFIX_08400 [Metabacillus herbersteinensis]|uniref:Group-specific protein n=1 Tax=Metabacillus herbersteinensis TaxID=283816 RepID=A0ABV6GCS2_9BACI
MSNCQLDHPKEDVMKKLLGQEPFLPSSLFKKMESFLAKDLPQSKLNELFHLLKKYDLVSAEEQNVRNGKIDELVGRD